MRLRPGGTLLAAEHTEKVVLLVHGLCMSDAAWSRGGHDHGAALERDLGVAPLTLSYNTGRHVSANGRDLAHQLEAWVASRSSPPRELFIVAHSVGGLVSRSALHYAAEAGLTWPGIVKGVVFLGTPHHGAPLERMGKILQAALGVSPYSAPFARLGKIRSAGITDLGHGDLLDEDWAGRDRFARRGDLPRPLPLPSAIAFHAIAAATDGLVPVPSALGLHPDPARALLFPPSRSWIAPETSHFELLSRPVVYSKVREWLSPR
jgi:hypothetical protein